MDKNTKALTLLLVIVLIGSAMIAPGWADEHDEELIVPFTPISSVYSEDFAVAEGDFTTGGTSGTWEFGVPASPPEILEGQTPNVWGTNLDGDHDSSDCDWIQSPAIDLSEYTAVPGGVTLARLSFQHWIDARYSSFSGNAWSGGIVKVSSDGEDFTPIDPIGGYDTDGVFSGQANCLGISTSQGIYSTLSTQTTAADDWRTGEFDVTEFLGGELHVRWFFGAGGTSITERGWYVDDVGVQIGVGASAPLPELPELPDPDNPLPSLGLQAPGWTAGGQDPSWEYGLVTDESSNAANIQGEVGYMTNLDGGTNNPECGYIQSPPIPGALLAGDPTLSFEHWYRIPGAFVNVAWGGGLVMVSGDGGLTWDYMDLPEYDRPLDYIGGNPECFTDFGAPIDGNVFSGANTQLHTVDVDLSDYADAPTVQVRFIYGAVTFAYEGWFIKQVDLGGTPLLP